MSRELRQGKFRKGIDQFNAQAFFEAHETWEEIWLTAAEPEKTFLQGIIQVSAAFHHYRRGNFAGARSLLVAGAVKLDRFPEDHNGLELRELRDAVHRSIAALDAGGDLGELPQIRPRKRG
jgi:predicted metal-dependent hydrolase